MSPREPERARGDRWIVGPDDAGVRLDKYLASGERLASRGRAFTALERGKVFVNSAEAGTLDATYDSLT